MRWSHPPIIKIYEALGAIADERIEIERNTAKVYSSSGNKFYSVTYDPDQSAIMVNDNGSFFKGYLGYPAIAFLMLRGELQFSRDVALKLKNIPWKDINQKFKNNFDKTLAHILSSLSDEDKRAIQDCVETIGRELAKKEYTLLGKKVKPPEGY